MSAHPDSHKHLGKGKMLTKLSLKGGFLGAENAPTGINIFKNFPRVTPPDPLSKVRGRE
jgi:hypothetical protein